jgi:flagellar basal-body rod modification protein FlgD
MSVSAINDNTAVQKASLTSSANDIMGKEDFLNLLVAQLQAQDPLNPMDSTDFTAQLAQFSSLEQLQNVNSNLEKLATYSASQNNALAAGFIDRTVLAAGDSFAIAEGIPQKMHFELEGDAASVYISVYDQTGELVTGFDAGAMSTGYQQYQWSGLDSSGKPVGDGRYTFEIMALGAGDESIGSASYIHGRVNGVTYYNNNAYLMMDGDIAVPLENVLEIASADDTEQPEP